MALNPALHDEIITPPIERMLDDKDIFFCRLTSFYIFAP